MISKMFSLQENLVSQLEMSSSENKKSVSDLQMKIDFLHSEVQERQTSLEEANEKVSKLDQISNERQTKLESLEKAKAKLEADLRTKVKSFFPSFYISQNYSIFPSFGVCCISVNYAFLDIYFVCSTCLLHKKLT